MTELPYAVPKRPGWHISDAHMDAMHPVPEPERGIYFDVGGTFVSVGGVGDEFIDLAPLTRRAWFRPRRFARLRRWTCILFGHVGPWSICSRCDRASKGWTSG